MDKKINNGVFTLHRYYLNCNRMRELFDESIKFKSENHVENRMYMDLWYSGLYVVIEGWRELKLCDDFIDELLESQNVDLLRRYRNNVFHFNSNYYDSRFLDFISSNDKPVDWVRELNRQFGRYFLKYFDSKKIKRDV